MEALLTSQREVEERTVHPVRQFYDLFTRVVAPMPACCLPCVHCGMPVVPCRQV